MKIGIISTMVFTSPSRGRRHSQETKKKISESLKGRDAWNKGLSANPSNPNFDQRVRLDGKLLEYGSMR